MIVERLLASDANPQARRSEALYRAARGRTTGHQACVRLLLLSDLDRWEAWEWDELPVSSRLRLEKEAHARHLAAPGGRVEQPPRDWRDERKTEDESSAARPTPSVVTAVSGLAVRAVLTAQ